jgi:hypothetical protein
MTNPDIANQKRRRAAPWPVFKLGITMEVPRGLLVRPRAMNDYPPITHQGTNKEAQGGLVMINDRSLPGLPQTAEVYPGRLRL